MNRILNSFVVIALALAVSACGKKPVTVDNGNGDQQELPMAPAPTTVDSGAKRVLFLNLQVDNSGGFLAAPTCAQMVYDSKDGKAQSWRIEVSRDLCPSSGLMPVELVDAQLSINLANQNATTNVYDVSLGAILGLAKVEYYSFAGWTIPKVKSAQLIIAADSSALKTALTKER